MYEKAQERAALNSRAVTVLTGRFYGSSERGSLLLGHTSVLWQQLSETVEANTSSDDSWGSAVKDIFEELRRLRATLGYLVADEEAQLLKQPQLEAPGPEPLLQQRRRRPVDQQAVGLTTEHLEKAYEHVSNGNHFDAAEILYDKLMPLIAQKNEAGLASCLESIDLSCLDSNVLTGLLHLTGRHTKHTRQGREWRESVIEELRRQLPEDEAEGILAFFP